MYAFQNVQWINWFRESDWQDFSTLLHLKCNTFTKKKNKWKEQGNRENQWSLYIYKKNTNPNIIQYVKHAPSLSEIHESGSWLCGSQSFVFRILGSLGWLQLSKFSRLFIFWSILNLFLDGGFTITSLPLLRSVFSFIKVSSLKSICPRWVWVWTTERAPRTLPTDALRDPDSKPSLQLGFSRCFTSSHKRPKPTDMPPKFELCIHILSLIFGSRSLLLIS